MKKIKFRYMALAVSIILALTSVSPAVVLGASADTSSKTIVKVKPGIGRIDVNGVLLPAEKPYRSGKVLFIPLKAVMEAFGADVIWNEDGRTSVLFKNISVEISVGKADYFKNQAAEKLSAPPVIRGKTLMVPSDFISKTFDITESANLKTDETSFVLENDGSLTDLSFLTGGLNKPRAGNSYFGWSLALPKGTVVASQTFNSKMVQFENDYMGAAIDIAAEMTEGRTLEEYYESILEDPYSSVNSDLLDSALSASSGKPFIELYYTDSYDEAIYHRIYSMNGYFINLIITSFDESNPEILKKDRYVAAILASFSLDYKGERSDTTDLSKVSFGLARYSNYISSDSTGKKFVTWEMSILPEWDLMRINSGSPYITEFGTGPREYVSIETSPAGDKTAEDMGKNIKSGYDSNLNPALYSMKKAEISEVAGLSAWSMLYEVKYGKTTYTYDERVIVSGGLMYDITFKISSASYEKKNESFENMLKTFKPYSRDAEALSAEMEKYKFNNEKTRLGKDDRPVLSENRTYLWNIRLPGRWQKNGIPGLSTETFFDPTSGGIIIVEALSKKSDTINLPDSERFSSMSMISNMELEPIKTDSFQAKGTLVKMYKYRIENEESDNYADATYYILEGQDYSYCYMYSISDMTSSETNLKTLAAAWDSFTIVEKNGEK